MTLSHSGSGVSIRRLEPRDIPSAMELSSEAGWNQLPEDWAALIQLAPESCFGIEIDGVLASTTTVICYGRKLAWIGMVLTRASFRGRGYAGLLMEKALTVVDKNQITSVKLDATDLGIGLYRKFGFQKEQIVERWAGYGLPSGAAVDSDAKVCEAVISQEIEELDGRAMGTHRGPLLKLLGKRSKPLHNPGGFAMHRPGRLKRYLGPCVAGDERSARKLISASLLRDSGRWFWDIPAANTEATRMAGELGFEVERRLTRMIRGESLRCDTRLLYAIAGFEIG
jgi:ribosomal protein S18 acetylase RimI-like enzyme